MKKFVRLPITTDRSLMAWSAVDEHILRHIEENDYPLENVSIYHDRFGYLTCELIENKPTTLVYLASQKSSIIQNAFSFNIEVKDLHILSVLENATTKSNVALMKIPKSLDLLRLYLMKIVESLPADGFVIGGFMTRHFIKSILEIANEYFEIVEQTKAWKKSRLLILSKPKKRITNSDEIINTINYRDSIYQQYLGVFSANQIDYATQFLLENIQLRASENSFLDIGCGNGVIGKYLLEQKTWSEAVLMDDSILATDSTLLNVAISESVKVLNEYNLDTFSSEQFDLIITNPPFHFEYEVDPSIAIQLMENTARILSPNGRLVIVANKHLNYKSQLLNWYSIVDILAQNDKFVIYQAEQSKV